MSAKEGSAAPRPLTDADEFVVGGIDHHVIALKQVLDLAGERG